MKGGAQWFLYSSKAMLPKNTEELLENVIDSIEKLGLYISAMTTMDCDDGIPSNELNAIMCGLHLQIY